jgi:cytidyltransferase-like protein
MKKIVIVSGYFNPLHKGHLEYFEQAKQHGDELWVIVNSDLQRELKGSKEFMKEDERLQIIQALRVVDFAIVSLDKDRTVRKSLGLIAMFSKGKRIAFANGGDQTNETIPEREVCEELGIELIDGLGDKVQSSSWLLKE